MATVKQHLAAHHSRSAAFDMSVATECEKLRKSFEALETHADSGDEMKKAFGDAKSSVARLSELFNTHAEYHRSMMAETAKAEDDELGKRLEPLGGVSAIVDPSRAPSGSSRLVPRSGQPTPDMPKVDLQFEHLVKIDE